MRAMVCEMCGGNDVVKQGGVYVCSHCGTKYVTEEARKLLVEISGPVSVDGVATADNLLDRAQEFLDKGDRARALEYVDRVLDIDARNERARDIQRALEYGRVRDTTTRGSRRPERLLGGVAIPEEKYQSIVAELHNGHKISDIKLVREATGWGPAETKAYTENVLMPTLGLAPRYGFANAGGTSSPKSRTMALLLCVLFGCFGAYCFYAGKVGKGVLYFLTAGAFCFG